MIKCKINRGKKLRFKTSGTGEDITKETAVLISIIYKGIHRNDPRVAEAYKNILLGILLDPDTPVWKAKIEEDNHGD